MIDPNNAWPIWAFIVAGVAACIYLEQNFRWAAKTSGPVLALLGGMLLSNSKLLPLESPTYDVVDGFLVPLAIPLLLLRANLGRIFKGTGKLFLAFHIAAVGTLIGAFLAAFLFKGKFAHLAEATGTMAASYIGGGVNFVALRNTYNLPATLSNPLLVADNFIMAGIFALLFLISTSKFFLSKYKVSQAASQDAGALAADYWKRKEISLSDLASVLAIAFIVTATAMVISTWMKGLCLPHYVITFAGNVYFLMTFITVLLTTIFHRWTDKLNGAEEIGGIFLYLFFFVIGLRADLIQVIFNVPVLFAFCLVIALVNLVFTLGIGRLFNIELEALLLSVNATLGGPASAAAMAISKGWPPLVLPALLIGIWGYVIGTVLGIFCAEAVRRLL